MEEHLSDLTAALEQLLQDLPPEELCELVHGDTLWTVPGNEHLGLSPVVFSDGPVGVRGVDWDDRTVSACAPSPSAVAATWDPQAAARLGELMASEAYRQGVDVVLAPTVNLHRTPVGGRHFECYSEDPLLTGRIAEGWVRGLQSHGVGACVKHFVANDQETDRTTVDNVVDEQTLHELYLAPFEHLEDSVRPWSYMSAYNLVNGTPMSWSPLVSDVLKGDWGSDAAVVTDWGANRDTTASGRGGVDISMPSSDNPWGQDQLLAAVQRGDVSIEDIREKVRSLLRLAARAGKVSGIDSAPHTPPATLDDDDISRHLRALASQGMVLVRNDGTLPLAGVSSVALIGPNAENPRHTGGGSATVFPRRVEPPLSALRAVLPQAHVELTPGVRLSTRAPHASNHQVTVPGTDEHGVLIDYCTREGRVLFSEVRRTGSFNWIEGYPGGLEREDVDHLRWRAVFAAERPGLHHLGASGIGDFTITLDGTTHVDTTIHPDPDRPGAESYMVPPQALHPIPLAAGQEVTINVTYRPRKDLTGGLDVYNAYLNIQTPWQGDEVELSRAEDLAAASDVAVVVVGTNNEVESEGFDRTELALPGRQDELVRRVAAANPRTVVVVNAGAPVLLPWLDDVAAVLLCWFPGQEMGGALADVLCGTTEPGGRMPTSWPASGQVIRPQNIPVNGQVHYTEGLDIGYRAYARDQITPALPFGSGMGYTSWKLGEATVMTDGVHTRLHNTGARKGSQVVQVYLRRHDSAVRRPSLWLVGFERISAPAGGHADVTIPLSSRATRHWERGWRQESGRFEVLVGFDACHLEPVGDLVIG